MVAVLFLTQSHSASNVMGSGCFFPIVREQVYEADTSLIRMEVKTHTSPALHLRGMVHLHIPSYTYDKSLEAKIAVLMCNKEFS
jgi:hypothetical protein